MDARRFTPGQRVWLRGEQVTFLDFTMVGDRLYAAGLSTGIYAQSNWVLWRGGSDGEQLDVEVQSAGTARGVFAAGDMLFAVGGTPSWTVRRSFDDGDTWNTVDLFDGGGALDDYAIQGGMIDDGTIVVIGTMIDGSFDNHVLVRASADHGERDSWATVADMLVDGMPTRPKRVVHGPDDSFYMPLIVNGPNDITLWRTARWTCVPP